jgi:hypothetical protein
LEFKATVFEGEGFRVYNSGFGVKVKGLGFRVLGFRV